jgi:hypothetical protein
MAQVYPEDRGTNYAIREGRAAAGKLAKALRIPADQPATVAPEARPNRQAK